MVQVLFVSEFDAPRQGCGGSGSDAGMHAACVPEAATAVMASGRPGFCFDVRVDLT
jgi:hypothetical protein